MAIKKEIRRDPTTALLFLCYVALMIYLLFFRNRTVTEGVPYWEQVQNNYNLVPWRTVGNYWDVLTRPRYYMGKWEMAVYRYNARVALVNIFGNVAMFVPLGALLPAMWPKLQRVWRALPVGFLTIALVEACQLLTLRGKCDVDDVLLNMTGITIGYVLWRFVRLCQQRKN